MTRVAISVEGKTEREFVNYVLAPFFNHLETAVIPISVDGNISLQRVAKEITQLLHSFDYVTTFYDFYGFKDKPADITADQLEEQLKQTVKEELRFFPYIQKLEFEALMFANPEITANHFKEPNKQKDLEKILCRYNFNPEDINGGNETHPSKRLEKLFSGYNKALDGPVIAGKIGLQILREQCPRFNKWIEKITQLVKNK